jgi:hypothetical protein
LNGLDFAALLPVNSDSQLSSIDGFHRDPGRMTGSLLIEGQQQQ